MSASSAFSGGSTHYVRQALPVTAAFQARPHRLCQAGSGLQGLASKPARPVRPLSRLLLIIPTAARVH
eukprot:9425366-Heterocapsa_arctica.AAC.1